MNILLILVIYLVALSCCEDCRRIGDTCYTAVVHTTSDISYNKAVDICKDRNKDIGLIRDENSYKEVMEFLRHEITKTNKEKWYLTSIWTGISFDPVNVRITSPGSFAEWFPGYLLTGKYLFEDFTNVWLTVFNDPDAAAQGMSNGEPIAQTYGVLCEMKLN
ncbi:uncharacterized protein LOC120331618 isoform X2 [Styela clava]